MPTGTCVSRILPEMVTCIRLCWDCADVCAATLGVVTRQTARDATVTRPLLESCAAVCKSCGDECERHAEHHEHCRICAQACRRCEQAGLDFLRTLRSDGLSLGGARSRHCDNNRTNAVCPWRRLTMRPVMQHPPLNDDHMAGRCGPG